MDRDLRLLLALLVDLLGDEQTIAADQGAFEVPVTDRPVYLVVD